MSAHEAVYWPMYIHSEVTVSISSLHFWNMHASADTHCSMDSRVGQIDTYTDTNTNNFELSILAPRQLLPEK